MRTVEVGRVEIGREYTYHALRAVKRDRDTVIEDALMGRYRVVAFALDAVTLRDLVIVEGVEGWDQGRWLIHSLADFAQKFRPIPPLEPNPEPTPAASKRVIQKNKD